MATFDLFATIVFDHRQLSAITERVEFFGRGARKKAGLRRAANAVALRFQDQPGGIIG
jgi:hypothetical protein